MLKLLLPVLFPSWRFFSNIGPSPRIYISFLQEKESEPQLWREFRPRPVRITFMQGLWRLFWNPKWNEMLYINTCAEHLFDEYSFVREQEIMCRILTAVNAGDIKTDHKAHFLLYRIDAVVRDGNTISQPTMFVSKPAALSGGRQ